MPGNTAWEYGLLGKQVAAVFQAVSCQTLIKGNVFFSGRRQPAALQPHVQPGA
jgi:hypothetical protein